jgi:DNA-binding NarL/FixJ family response regulator
MDDNSKIALERRSRSRRKGDLNVPVNRSIRVLLVGAAVTGADALAAAAEQRPDLILFGLESNGFTELDAFPKCCNARALVLTGSARNPIATEATVTHSGTNASKAAAEPILQVEREEARPEQATADNVITALPARRQEPTGRSTPDLPALTPKEREIIVAVTNHRGLPIKVIADALCLSAYTVRNHLARIYAKLGMNNRVDLFIYAREHGLDKYSPADPHHPRLPEVRTLRLTGVRSRGI